MSFLLKLAFLFINIAGFSLAYVLIRQENFQSNFLIQKFCKTGTHIDCYEVTKSHYSKLFGILSWAELGMAYFSTVTLWVILAPVSNDWISSLWILLILPLPFTIWSIYTQAFLIRKWCIFCCMIILLLWANASIFYCFLSVNYAFSIIESSFAAFLLLACIAIVIHISKTNKIHNPYSVQREMARIKYNPQITNSQLSNYKHNNKQTGFSWADLQAFPEIALYVSVACSHCGTAVKELRWLMDIYPNFNYRLIFAINTDITDENSIILIRHFIILYKNMNKNDFFDMLDTWYALPQKTLETLQKNYPISSTQNNYEEDMDILYEFNRQAKINYTPAILYNGQLLSQLYTYRDLYGILRAINAK